ncbi:hypothetical protein ACSBR2_008442 [Camellia fascicularis]
MAGLSPSHPSLDSISLDDGDEINEEMSNRCLIGKILAPKLLNKQAASSIIRNAWTMRASLFHLGTITSSSLTLTR